MAFVFKYTKDGSTPQTKYYQAAGVTITKGELLYWSGGYVTNATAADCETGEVAGVAEETKVCTQGNLIPVQVNRMAVYSVGTADTMAQTSVGFDVPVATGQKTVTVASDTATSEGVCKVEKMIAAGATGTGWVEVSINFSDPGA